MEEKLSFEQALERLEEVVRELEGGDLSLEQALALFQERVALARQCEKQLDQAEARIEQLLEADGQVIAVPLDQKQGRLK